MASRAASAWVRGYEGDQLALICDVKRINAQDFAGAFTSGRTGTA